MLLISSPLATFLLFIQHTLPASPTHLPIAFSFLGCGLFGFLFSFSCFLSPFCSSAFMIGKILLSSSTVAPSFLFLRCPPSPAPSPPSICHSSMRLRPIPSSIDADIRTRFSSRHHAPPYYFHNFSALG